MENQSDNFLDLNSFEREKKIYKGSLCKIFQIRDIKTQKKYIAKIMLKKIKELPKRTIIELSSELNNLIKFNHPSIQKIIGYSPIDFKGNEKPVIISEYYSNNSLKDLLNKINNNQTNIILNDTKKLIIIYGIAAGMSYLHLHEIIHCDLQLSNIFLDDNLFPKIGDFGSSREISQKKDSKIKGNPKYSSPEVLLNLEYSKTSDVYAFSIIVYSILKNEEPFKGVNDIKEFICQRPELNEQIPKIYHDLLMKCWSQKPEERPSFDEILTDLKSNSKFITEKVNKDEFFNFVKMIDESKINFDSTKKIYHLEKIIQSQNNSFKSDSINSKDLISDVDINFDLKKFHKKL